MVSTCGLIEVEAACASGSVDEVLAVMPRAECADAGAFRWPKVSQPRTVIEVSDLGCGDLVSHEDLTLIAAQVRGVIVPSASHVSGILRVGRLAAGRAAQHGEWRLLCHCHAGSSRSVAAAYVILADLAGEGNEQMAFRLLVQACGDDEPSPNLNMVAIADRILGRGGAMLGALGHPRISPAVRTPF